MCGGHRYQRATFRSLLTVARPVVAKIRDAVRTGMLEKTPAESLAERALEADIITSNEKGALDAADAARLKAVQVDWFDVEAFATVLR